MENNEQSEHEWINRMGLATSLCESIFEFCVSVGNPSRYSTMVKVHIFSVNSLWKHGRILRFRIHFSSDVSSWPVMTWCAYLAITKLNDTVESVLCIHELLTGHSQLILRNMPWLLAEAVRKIRQPKPTQREFKPKFYFWSLVGGRTGYKR